MTGETQPQIHETVALNGQRVWINLAHVVSIVRVWTTDDEHSIIRISMTNGDMFQLKNDPSETYTMWADQFLFALNAFHNQSK